MVLVCFAGLRVAFLDLVGGIGRLLYVVTILLR